MVSVLPTMSVWARSGSTYGWVGDVATYESVDCEVRHLDPGHWSIKMPYNTQAALFQPGRLVTVDFRNTRFTGIFDTLAPQSDEQGRPVLEASGPGAYALIGDATTWPDPANTLSAQTVARYTASGAAETVLRQVMTAQLTTRRGDPIVVPTTGTRGGTVNLDERFTNLMQLVSKKARRGGLAVTVDLVTSGGTDTSGTLQVQFRVPVDKSNTVWLSYATGSLKTWKQTDTAPTVTRPIVMGSGKGLSRVIRGTVRDTAAEARWDRSIERIVDVRGTSSTTELDEEAQSALDDGTQQSSFEISAVEGEGVIYGTDFLVGDQVLVELMTGLTSVERVNAVRMHADKENGMTIEVVPGNPDTTNPWFRTHAILRAFHRRIHNLEREES